MINTILIILVVLVAICLGAVAFLFGVLLSIQLNKRRLQRHTRDISSNQMSEEDIRKQQRFLKEMQNFLTYTGDEQEDIQV